MRKHRYDREVAVKTEKQVERSTAEAWAGRALACYRRYKAGDGLKWLLRGEAAAHEAVEHAAGVGGAFVEAVKRKIAKARPRVR